MGKWRICKQLLDEVTKIWGGSMRLYCVEKLLRKRLWTCHKTDYRMNIAWCIITCHMLKHVLEVIPYSSRACLVRSKYLSICPVFFNSCHRLPETKRHSSLFIQWSGSKFLVVMAACTPSIHAFLGHPLFLLSHGIQSIINFGILSSGIFLMWPYHCSLFCSMISMMSGFPFTPIISFICSFFILSILDFLADLLSTSISVDKILFISVVGICHTSAPYTKMLWIDRKSVV